MSHQPDQPPRRNTPAFDELPSEVQRAALEQLKAIMAGALLRRIRDAQTPASTFSEN